jgi:aryl-alcohol dehydrogenase-like predicted oxidoreductase
VAPIVGARTARHLDDSLGAAGLRLDDAQRARLDEVSAPPTPDYPYGFITEQTSDRPA